MLLSFRLLVGCCLGVQMDHFDLVYQPASVSTAQHNSHVRNTTSLLLRVIRSHCEVSNQILEETEVNKIYFLTEIDIIEIKEP